MPGFSLVAVAPPLFSAALATMNPQPSPETAIDRSLNVVVADWSLAPAQAVPPPGDDQGEPAQDGGDAPADDRQGSEIVVEGRYGPPESDPAEQINAVSYEVSQAIDQVLVEPLAYAYRDGLPEPVRDGIGNLVRNLGEPSNALNFLLQGKVGKAFETLARLAINSSLGLGGLIDVAAKPGIGLPYRRNGFANTLGYYGVGPGPYLFLPITGPTTVRDQVGITLDQALLPFLVGKPFNRPEYGISYFVLNGLDSRLRDDPEITAIRASDDPYTTRRETYLARRAREIAALKGKAVEQAGARPEPEPAPPPAESDAPPLSLIEQVQITAHNAPATR